MTNQTVSRKEFEALKAETGARIETLEAGIETLEKKVHSQGIEIAQLWDWVAELEPQVRGLTQYLTSGVQHVKNIMYSKSQALQSDAFEWTHKVNSADADLFDNALGKLEYTEITADQSKRPVRSK